LRGADASWVAGAHPPPGRYAAKTRYRQGDAACTLGHADRNGMIELAFDVPQWAVTPGQSAVLYDGAVCLGGAVIASSDAVAAAPPQSSSQSDRSSVVVP
jgi:tRNA-specific 2-thiouridylase